MFVVQASIDIIRRTLVSLHVGRATPLVASTSQMIALDDVSVRRTQDCRR